MAATNNIPKVAIITRTKNRIVFLERAIKSVESQTYKDYVHVILNDGGDPGAVNDLLEKYKSSKRIVVHNKESVGITRALNQAILAANSRYITILDDDDSWPDSRLEKTIAYLEESNSKVVAVKMDIVTESVVDGQIKRHSKVVHPQSDEGEISLYKQCFRNYLSNGIITYSRDIYKELKGYDESLPTAEDWDFGIRLLLKYDVPLLREEESLCYYHQRPEQSGVSGNSAFAEIREQERTINLLRNHYLRKELNTGRLSVGYIMNKLSYDDQLVVRLEGHTNYTADKLVVELEEKIDGLMASRMHMNRLSSRIKRYIKPKDR
jgi:glycosyltransferase involved in cell wall biosynthesis